MAKPFWEKEGFSFGLTVVTVSILFIFFGYLMGQYAVELVGTHSQPTQVQPSPRLAQEIEEQLERLQNNTTSTTPSQPATSQPQRVEQRPVAQPAPPASSSTQSSSGALFRVQVGAFSQRANAEVQVENLKKVGYEAIITAGPPFRVQTGAFSSRENAQRLAEELQGKGFQVTIIQ